MWRPEDAEGPARLVLLDQGNLVASGSGSRRISSPYHCARWPMFGFYDRLVRSGCPQVEEEPLLCLSCSLRARAAADVRCVRGRPTIVYRRDLLAVAAGLSVAPAAASSNTANVPFTAASVRATARDLASQPYKPLERGLPDMLSNLDYSTYQTLRFDPAKALWRGPGETFSVEFFHRGYLFQDRVDVMEVVDGIASPIVYRPDMFDLSKVRPAPPDDLGFAGFRVLYPLNRPDYHDEVCAFLGASYFRAVARGQGYGLSARGLAIKTADPSGEEFPLFKRFWLERPAPGSDVMVIHALLDSPSAAAALRFTVRPGEETAIDTEMALYPREELKQVGLAPMTSMFLFDAINRAGFDDYRAAVHDSQGLQLLTGRGERIWRTLNNSRTLQVSAFQDTGPRGFGLTQRERSFVNYQDMEAVYEKRPSLWAETIGDWGVGGVMLVEIPSEREVNDNVVAFWRPKDALMAKAEYLFSYRLHWCWEPADDPAIAKVTQARAGLSFDQKRRQFVIDFSGSALKGQLPEKLPELDIGSDKGEIQHPTLQPMPDGETCRVSFQLDTRGEKVIEMHARLLTANRPASETWIYRWTS